jgi:hypothetical protein
MELTYINLKHQGTKSLEYPSLNQTATRSDLYKPLISMGEINKDKL